MKHVQQMIEQHGGFEAVRTRYLRLENPPFMRLVIDDPFDCGLNTACSALGNYGFKWITT
jgi:hypothetical protein